MAADHLFELDADLLALATELEGHPDNVAAALRGGFVDLRRRRGDALRRRRPGWRRWRSCPSRPCARARRARRCRRRCRWQEAVFNVAHARAADARPGQRRLGPASRAACTTACTSSAARDLFPRSYELALRARELGALGATISGAGPTVLVWCFYEQTGAVVEALGAEIDGWATLLRTPFEPQGAYVGGALSELASTQLAASARVRARVRCRRSSSSRRAPGSRRRGRGGGRGSSCARSADSA